MSSGRVTAVCIGATSGFPRPRVGQGELRADLGFVGNKHSVGGAREVCLFEAETYDELLAEGMRVGPGSFGENLVVQGIPFARLQPGDRLRIGRDAVLEITIVRKPCSRLTPLDPRLPDALIGRSGWMARVASGGVVREGDLVELVPRAEG